MASNTTVYIGISFFKLVRLIYAEVKKLPNKKSKAGTNAQQVKKQNKQSAQSQPGQYGTEFAEETDVQKVKKQNQQSQQKKAQQNK